jgi:Na+-translocating ferredoxin:NAD+ oxidoreductase RNF subunit RnfB
MTALTGLIWYGWLIVALPIVAVFFMVLAIRSKWFEVDDDPEIDRHV